MDLSELILGERAGRGGMGVVHRAQWRGPVDTVDVAVKFLRGATTAASDAAFLREARAAARLSHPNIVALLDAGRASTAIGGFPAGVPYLIMEWVSGETAHRSPPQNWAALSGLLRELLSALAHAHAWGVLHRDLKPSNVMCGPSGARLMDFGIGRLLDDLDRPEGSKGPVVGTPRYMAPEQVLGEWRDEGPWTDIYGLGALAWELATGKPLFDGSGPDVMLAHVRERLPAFNPRFKTPHGLRNWLFTALDKDPGSRFQSAAEALTALGDLQQSERTSRYPVVTPGRQSANVGARMVVPQRHTSDDRALATSLRAAGAGLFGMRQLPIVGREQEKELIWNAFRRVARLERAEAAVVVGPAGSGKSSLAQWLARRAAEGGYAPVLWSFPQGELAGEATLSGAVARWFRLEGLPLDEARSRLAKGLDRLGFDDAATLALDVLARTWPEATDRRGLQDTADWHAFLLEFARRIGEGRPTVWIVEDIDSGAATEFLRAAAAADQKLLLVATARVDPGLDIRRSFDVPLKQLDPAALREHVHSLLPLEPLLAELVAQRAEGSAMFAAQIVSDWVARGVLEAGTLGYRVPEAEMQSLPASVHEIWSRRVQTALADQPSHLADALSLGAVLGREFALEEWRRACSEHGLADPDAAFELLQPSGLLELREQNVRFAHSLLHDSIMRDAVDLQRLHLSAARAVAAVDPTPLGAERAARHLWAAGDRLGALDRLYEAINRYFEAEDADAVIMLVPVLREWAEAAGEGRNLCLADALHLMGRTLHNRSGAAAAAEPLEHARRIVFHDFDADAMVSTPDPLRNRVAAQVCIQQGLGMVHRGEHDEALAQFELAGRLARAADVAAETLLAASLQSDVLTELGRVEEAAQVIERAFDGDKSDLAPRALMIANLTRADVYDLRGDHAAAVAAADEALRAAARRGGTRPLAHVHGRRGDMLFFAGRLDEARDAMNLAADLYGDDWTGDLARMSLLVLDIMDGRAAQLRTAAHHMFEICKRDNLARFERLAQMAVAVTEAASGAVDRATRHFRAASVDVNGHHLRETVILAVALAECAAEPLRAEALAFARSRAVQLPAVYAKRLAALQAIA